MLKNQIRRIMFGFILVMIGLMSAKKLNEALETGALTSEIEEVHTVQV